MTVRIFPAVLIILLTVFFGADYFLMKTSNKEFTKTEVAFRKDLNEYLSKSFTGVISPQTEEAVCKNLYDAYKEGFVAFFLMRSDSRGVLCFDNKSKNPAELNLRYKILDQTVAPEGSPVAYRATQSGDYLLVTGTINDSDETIAKMEEQRDKHAFFYYLKGLIVFATVLYIAFGWIFKFLKNIRESKYVPSSVQGGISKFLKFQEVSLLAKASEATYQKLTETENELALVSSSLTKTLIEEIKSKRSILPYTFDATVLRLDLNNYTKTFLNSHPGEMISLIEKFAANCDEIIHRYDGLIYQFIGDEFVVAFRDYPEKGLTGKELALACVRDVFSSPISTADLKLTMKASICSEKLTFFHLPFGYFYTGLPLIKSQRMLNEVSEKNANALVIDQAVIKEASVFGKFGAAEEVTFKGFDSKDSIYRLVTFYPQDNTQAIPYRTDQGIVYLLEQLRLGASLEANAQIIRELRKIHSNNINPVVAAEWLKTFKTLNTQETDDTQLSSFIMSAENLIPKTYWSTELSEALLSIQDGKDPRVYANAAEIVLSKESAEKFAEKLSKMKALVPDSYFRLTGNILCGELKQNLTKPKLQALLFMLESSNERAVTTAIWVTGEIVHFHIKHNRARLEAHTEFEGLKKRLATLSKSANALLASRAQSILNIL